MIPIMKTYKLVYNPYKVETKLFIVKENGILQPISEDSSLAPIFHQRMQKWIVPHDLWKGFFAELKEVCGESHIELLFVGTAEDYSDLLYACKQYAPKANFSVDLTNVLSKGSQMHINGEYKLWQIQELIKDAQENADASVLPEDVIACLDRALDPYFEINVVAPVSAGKSTLQNALIGRRLLPTSNEAKTAVLTRTRINNGMSDFRAESLLHDGTKQVHNEPVTQKLINTLNDEIDPADPSGESALRDIIYLEGPSPQFEDCALDLVFVDTPGGNNAMNERHKEVMRKALFAENKNVILFVFSQNTISHENTLEALKEAAEAMRQGLNGKMSQDRFLFVCTGCDLIPGNLAGTEKSIRNVLNSCGITDPNLFMVSSLVVELLRTEENNQAMIDAGLPQRCDRLSKQDKNLLESCIKQLALPECDLYAHASISESHKQIIGSRITELKEAYEDHERRLEDIEDGYIECSPEDQVRLRKELVSIGKQLAMLNSGIPGLEIAIREYLNRYAIPMKIQQACMSLRAKADEAEMLKKVADQWTSSNEAAEAAKKEAEARKAELDRSKVLKGDRKKLQALTIGKNGILTKSSSYVQQLENLPMPQMAGAKHMKIDGKEGAWIRKESAQQYLDTVNRSLMNNMKLVVNDMTDYFNDNIVSTCNQIMDDYRKHIEALKESGAFNLAGLDVSKIIAATPGISSTIDVDGLAKSRREIVGSKSVAKKGFWNGVKRFFGYQSGFEKVSVYGDVEYVFILDLYTTQRARMVNAFHNWVSDETDALEDKLETLKNDVSLRMDKLDEFIQKLFKEYIAKLGDSKLLQKEAEKWKVQSEWLESFLEKVNNLLDVESVDSATTEKKG